jgi:hypothetical protein
VADGPLKYDQLRHDDVMLINTGKREREREREREKEREEARQ